MEFTKGGMKWLAEGLAENAENAALVYPHRQMSALNAAIESTYHGGEHCSSY
jgi:hypothetical protein